MPSYSYFCQKCKDNFELFFYIKDYTDKPKCPTCNKNHTERLYSVDAATINTSVRKSDSELKTLGDLAKRNTDRMSEDQKVELYVKHNDYKENKIETKPLPSGMSYKKKPKYKTKWPGT